MIKFLDFQNFWHEYFARILRRKNGLPTLLEIDTSKVGRQFVHHFVEYLFWRPWNANKLHRQETQCSSPESPSRRPQWESTVKLAGYSQEVQENLLFMSISYSQIQNLHMKIMGKQRETCLKNLNLCNEQIQDKVGFIDSMIDLLPQWTGPPNKQIEVWHNVGESILQASQGTCMSHVTFSH